MAQINTTFGFKDEVTQGLSLLNNSLSSLNKTLAEMQGQMSGANSALKHVEQASESTEKKVGGLSTKLLNFNAVVGVIHTVKGAMDSLGSSIAECSSLYNFQMEQEMKLETVMRNHMKATDEQIQQIKDLASSQQETGIFGDEMQLAGLQELATYVDDAETLKGLLPVLNSMVAQGVGTGATARDMQSYATMMGKVMQGQVGGMSKRGYKFTEAEEEILKTGTELEKLEIMQRAVLGNFGDMNKALAQTPQGQIIQLNNTLGDMKENIGKDLVPFQQLFKISTMKWKIKFYDTIAKALEGIKKNIKTVVIAVTAGITAIGAALLVLGGYYAYVNRQAIILQVTQIQGAIKSAAAWIIAHAPLLLIIAAIVAIIAIIALLLKYSETTFPIIGGVIGGVAAVAKQTGAIMKHAFQTAIESIVNGFLKMKDKVSDFFLSMLDVILGGIERIAPAIDAVFHMNIVDEIAGFRQALQGLKEAAPPEFKLGWSDDRLPGGFEEAWRTGKAQGSASGAELSAKWQAWLDKKLAAFNNNELAAASITEEEIKDLLNFDSSGAVKVTDKGLVDIAEDYRELLSQKATERFNLRFSQTTPQVTFGDVNINSDKDGENILERFVDKMEEAAASKLGVN